MLLLSGRRPWLRHYRQNLREVFGSFAKDDYSGMLSLIEARENLSPDPGVRQFWAFLRGMAWLGQGDFRGAQEQMENSFQVLYATSNWRRSSLLAMFFSQRLQAALLAQDFGQALALWDQGATHLRLAPGSQLLYHYFFSPPSLTREQLTQFLQKNLIPRWRALALHLLGRLDLLEGHSEEGLARIGESARLLPGHWLAQEPQRLATHQERLGAAQAGSRWLAKMSQLANQPGEG